MSIRETIRKKSCPGCGHEDTHLIVEVPNMPVNVGGLWRSAEEARRCARGDMAMCHCPECQLIFNAAFDPELTEYGAEYDNSLEASAVFRDYLSGLAQELIDRHDLHDKKVIEIGCGKGAFIGQLCTLGPNDGIGFDTTHDASAANPAPGRLRFVKAHYSAEQTEGGVDLVASRHVFEHIPEPLAFLRMLRESLGDATDTLVFFEVPEALFIVRDLSIWDLIYEHCNYFGHESLTHIFSRAGFEVLGLRNTYDDQFLCIEARPSNEATPAAPEIAPEARIGPRVADFTAQFEARQREWRERLGALAGKRVVIWAAGAKTVSFMNLFQIADQIDSIVDINPRKQGKHLPGTGQKILHPDELAERKPDTVIVMNAHYRDEIEAQLADMGLHPEILTA